MRRFPIRGAQSSVVRANNAGLNVIRARKVYDWVVASTTEQITSPIPSTCLPQILDTRSIDISCCSTPTGTEHEAMVTSIRRNVPGLPAGAALVNLVCTLLIRLGISGRKSPCGQQTNCPVCCIESRVPFVLRNLVICLPEGLDESNFTCKLLCCQAMGMVFDNQLEIDISVGLGIQVEAEVKLEVNAKFAQPRNPIPIPPPQNCPPVVVFPSNCQTIFPIPNCTCQGSVAAATTGTTLTESGLGTQTGDSSIRAAICPECNPAGSFVNYAFNPTVNPGGFLITFTSSQISPASITCGPIVGAVGTILTVSGVGRLIRDNIPTENVPFTLTLTQTTTLCTYQLMINPGGTSAGIPIITTAVVPVVCNTQLVIRNCRTLPINTT